MGWEALSVAGGHSCVTSCVSFRGLFTKTECFQDRGRVTDQLPTPSRLFLTLCAPTGAVLSQRSLLHARGFSALCVEKLLQAPAPGGLPPVDFVILRPQLSALVSVMGLVTCHFPCMDCLLRQDVWRGVKGFPMVP